MEGRIASYDIRTNRLSHRIEFPALTNRVKNSQLSLEKLVTVNSLIRLKLVAACVNKISGGGGERASVIRS